MLLRRCLPVLALTGAAGFVPAAHAQSPQFPPCPTTVEVAQQFTGTAPEGWQVVQRPTDRRIVDIRFQNGPSPTEPFIAHSSGSGPGASWSLHYEFPASRSSVYMVCIYADTAFAAIREVRGPLPPRATVTYDHVNFRTTLSYP
ncbi:hypothetical protein GXW78_25470 [Roseomonas terrae]|uniref:Secreted protein n=1 Tax=Neoroseomonas terrae TaxID=424799 RepID=A0ABS5EPT1_9PROT|nr:STY0301 family protein [Neoroseomonas terrae]MBR0653031.1 hypothetical protein [Neoroseomonas terrae]